LDLIVMESMGKVYRSGPILVEALKDLDLVIRSGEFVSIMGPSGSGKSTLMNIIGCLDVPSSGRYLLQGLDTGTLNRDTLAEVRNRKIGFVFQGFNLLPRIDAMKNVELPLIYAGIPVAERRARAESALALVGLADRTRHLPAELSGGQQQRTAIARALVTNPELILADEPTGNLDSRTSAEIMELFSRLNGERRITFILVTHNPEIAEGTARNIFLKDGMIESDTPGRASVSPLRSGAPTLDAASGRSLRKAGSPPPHS
jgi:putative ABC transport system ATP-binding protein